MPGSNAEAPETTPSASARPRPAARAPDVGAAERRGLGEWPLHWVLLAYPPLWWGGYVISNAYWFLPVGLRVAVLLRVAPRHWPWLGLTEFLTIWALVSQRSQGYSTWLSVFLGMMMPWLIFAAAIGLWRRREPQPLPTSPQSLARLLALGLAASALVALELLLMRWVEGFLDTTRIAEAVFSYLIGDFIGLLVVVPLLVQAGDPRAAWRNPLVWRALGITLVPLGLLLWTVGEAQPAALPFVALFAIVPPLWLAHRFGWRGAAMAVTGVSAIVYFSTAKAVSPDIASLLQMFLAIVGGVALTFGAWTGLERRLRAELEASLAEIADANAQLREQADDMRDLGRRLVTAQEDERRRIRADLRGELSQQISALSTQIAMLVRQVDRPELIAMVDGMRSQVQAVRDAADECLDRLQPRAMSRSGLLGGLTEGPIAHSLQAAGLTYSAQIVGDAARLDDDSGIQVYRIVQHLASALLRYSDAVSLEVVVKISPAGEEIWIELDVVLGCASTLLPQALNDEPDVRAVRDRMFASQGRLELESVGEGRVLCRCGFPALARDAVGDAR